MYVYRNTNPAASSKRVYTVGFFDTEREWIEESTATSSEQAAQRVNYLNGGLPCSLTDLMEAWLDSELGLRDKTKHDV